MRGKVIGGLIAVGCLTPVPSLADNRSYSDIAQSATLMGSCQTLAAALEVNETLRSSETDRLILALWRRESDRLGMIAAELRYVCQEALSAREEFAANLEMIDEFNRISEQLSSAE